MRRSRRACVNYRPPTFTPSDTDTLLANMRAAGIASSADAEGDDRFGDGAKIDSETATTTTPSSTLPADASPEPNTTRA